MWYDHSSITKVENGLVYFNHGKTCLDYRNAKSRLANTIRNRSQFADDKYWKRAVSISQSYVDAFGYSDNKVIAFVQRHYREYLKNRDQRMAGRHGYGRKQCQQYADHQERVAANDAKRRAEYREGNK